MTGSMNASGSALAASLRRARVSYIVVVDHVDVATIQAFPIGFVYSEAAKPPSGLDVAFCKD